MPESKSTRKVVVGVRVDPPERDAIDALRERFATPDGKRTSRSNVLRGLLRTGRRSIADPEVLRTVQELAQARGEPVETTWRAVALAGIAALRSAAEAD